MKRILAVILAVVFAAGFSSPVFAAKTVKKAEKEFERIVAEVQSVDVAARTIVVKREENGEIRTISISEKAASQVQVGNRVRIKLKAGTNESAGVRVLGAKPVVEDVAGEPEAKDETTTEVE